LLLSLINYEVKKIFKSYVTACVGIQTNEKVDLNIDHMIAAYVCCQ
jgi:hypothetical protein